MYAIGKYIAGLQEAAKEGGFLTFLLMMIWLLYPCAVVTVFHPSDAVGLQLWLQGFVVPDYMTHRALNEGEGAALFVLFTLSVFQFLIIALIYRRIQFMIEFWPAAVVLIGGIANGLWWIKTGHFDPEGALAGLTPLVAAVICHGVCERLGAEFVFGPGEKPHYEPEY
jgi:hypothetical protein